MQDESIVVLVELGEKIKLEMAQIEQELAKIPDVPANEARIEELMEQLAILTTELAETRPASRYEWWDAKPVKDLWKEKVMSNESQEAALKAKISEVVKALKREVLPLVQEVIAARDAAEIELRKSLEFEERFRDEIQVLESRNKGIRAEIAGLLSSGKDPAGLLAQARQNADRIEALQEWLNSQDNIPLLKKAVEEAKGKLQHFVEQKIKTESMPKFQRKANALCREVIEWLNAWDKGTDEFCVSLNFVNQATSLQTFDMNLRMRTAPKD